MNELKSLKKSLSFSMMMALTMIFLVGLPINQTYGQGTKHQVSGVVKDEKGEVIIGASVVEQGTTNGVMTDVVGHFILTLKVSNSIKVSSVGYKTVVINASGKSNINVVLYEDSKMLNDVVVVGFATQKKVNVTGAVSVVTAKEIASRPVANAAQALQGLTPGLQIAQSNGTLEDNPSINVRGTATIGEGSSGSPLILIDGMEADINTINPQDIASISVLKDAAASSIYGSRAPFGVILITTKTGGEGKLSINYNNSFRITSPVLLPEEMDSYTFATYFNDACVNANWSPYFDTDRLQRIKDYRDRKITNSTIPRSDNPLYWGDYDYCNDNVDWYKAIFKNHGFSQEHNLSARGGNKMNSYYFSADYMNENGLMKYNTDQMNRYAITAKIKSQLKPWLDMQYTMRFTRNDYKRPSAMTSSLYWDLARQGWPVLPLYDPNGHLFSAPSPALGLAQGGTDKIQTDNTYHQLSLVMQPVKNWITHVELNYHIKSANRHWDTHPLYNHDVNGNPYIYDKSSNVHEDYDKENYYNINIYSEYSWKIKNHNFKLMGGFQAEELNKKLFGLQNSGILIDNQPEIDLTSGMSYDGTAVVPSVNGSSASWSTAGFFSRINYDYDGRYLAEANFRYDGTSRFRRSNRWKMFPSFSLGWNIAREAFWEPLSQYIGSLKLRASYGELGNQNTDNWYPTYRTITYASNKGEWLQNGTLSNIATEPALVSSTMTWEKVRTWNVGLDWGAFNNRLTGSLDIYSRRTIDMVGPLPNCLMYWV